MRVGVGRPPANWDVADYVLGKFSQEQAGEMEVSVARAADAVEVWIAEGIQQAMNKFNADPNKPKKKQIKKDQDSEPSDLDDQVNQTQTTKQNED